MSNFKKKPSVPQDTDLRQIGNHSIILGGTLRSSEPLPTTTDSELISTSGYLQTQIDDKASTSYVDSEIDALTLSGGTSQTYVDAQDLSVSGYLQSEINGLESNKMQRNANQQTNAHEYWISPFYGNDSNLGSFDQPFQTIQYAFDQLGDGGGFAVFNLGVGDYYEDITVSGGRSYVLVMGQSIGDLPRTNIHGKMLITGTNTTGISFKDVEFSQNAAQLEPILTIDCDSPNNTFKHCRFHRNGAGVISGTKSIVIDNMTNGEVTFENTSFETLEVTSGCTSGALNLLECSTNNQTDITIPSIELSGKGVVLCQDLKPTGNVVHHNGLLVIEGGFSIGADGANVSIDSDAGASAPNGLILSNVNFFHGNLPVGKINKTGQCLYVINNVMRDPAQDVLSGTRAPFGSHIEDLFANRLAVSYTSTGDMLSDHLNGVDASLGMISGTLNVAISDIEDFKPADTWYVDGISGNDINNTSYGSFNRPYKTIGAALSGIGNLPLQKVFVLAADSSAPTENLLITQEDLTIQGIGTTNSYAFTVNANLVISGANRVQLKDLHIHTPISGTACIQEIGSSGISILDNVTLTHGFPDQLGYQAINGTNGGGTNFQNCYMSEVNVEINQASSNNYNFVECFNKQVVTTSGNFVVYRHSRAAGPFVHNGGGLILADILSIRTYDDATGEAVTSTAGITDGVLAISNTGLVQPNGYIAKINKTGDCPIALSRVQRDPSQDILTGFRFYPEGSFDISASYTPINYTAADEFVPAHLAGIDAAIGLGSRRVSIPTTASDPGQVGDYAVDANYRYDCISTDTWVRVPVSTF